MPPIVSIGGVHLMNSTGSQVAGGVATAATTTPFSFSGAQLQASVAETFFSGGAPFVLGSRPVYAGYTNVTQTWICNVQGTTHEGAVASLLVLKQAIQRALFDTAALLAVQPTASSTIMYAEVYSASVQEINGQGLIPIEGATDIDFELTFTRSPFFTPAGVTTLINGATFTNTGTGANNNTQSLGTPAGDLIYEGQPLNIKFVPANAQTFDGLFAATVYQRTYTASVATNTSAGTGIAFRDTTSGLVNPARTRNGLRLRALLRLTALSANAQLQAVLVSRPTNNVIWYGPRNKPGVLTGAIASAVQVDLTPQGVSLDMIRRAQLTSGDVDVAVFIFSSDGLSASVTTHSMETLLYYTFCRINTGMTATGTAEYLYIEQAQNLNGTAYQPAPGVAYVVDLSGSEYLTKHCDVRGTLPLAISGASLYLSWTVNTVLQSHTNTNTATVTVKNLPLFRTYRGA